MKTRISLLSAAILASMQATAAPADSLIISGVVDGPLPGGLPKAVEIYVAKDIDDISQCGLGSANNGGGTDGEEFTFPSGAVSAGQYLYVASESAGFSDFFGFSPNYTSSAANINGDDAIELFCDGAVVDTFGETEVDGTGQAWEHLDGWAYRIADTGPDDGNFVLANWQFSGPNALDGESSNDSAVLPFPLASFTGDGGGSPGDPDPVDPDPVEPGEGGEGLLFSEYVEGSSFNKAIELANTTDATLDLSGYQVLLYSNSNTNAGTTLDLTGSLAAGEVLVIANSQAADAIQAVADVISGVTNFNGNDALELRYNNTLVDSIGQVGSGQNFGSNVTLVRKADTAGDTDSSDTFVAAEQWQEFASDTFTYLGSHNGDDGGDTPVVELGQCGDPATLISQIQGSGDVSPVASESHIVEAVVTGTFTNLQGYFVQEEVADWDNDANTSEGVFVYTNSDQNLPQPGTLVRVQGEVSEFFDKTQLTVSAPGLDCGQADTPTMSLSLPFADAQQPESLEGMLVSFEHSLTVTDNYNLGRYGEVTLSNGRTYIPTNLHLPGSAVAQSLAEENALNRILLDDGINGQNPETVIYPTGGLSAFNTLRTGDLVSSLSGVLDYGFGEYRIIPVEAPTFVASNPRTPAPEIAEGNLKVASLNVLNFFNGDGQGGGFPTPRGADNSQEYQRQLDKLVSAILTMDADVVGLMEIENDGYDQNSAIAQLTDALNALAGESVYAYVDAGGQLGTDAIAVGLLYKTGAVTPVGDARIHLDSVYNRPPLAQRFSNAGGGELSVIVNHFKSKGGCGSADGLDQDQGDGQACFNATRVAQARALLDWIATDEQLSSEKNHLVIGDLNAYAKEDPIRAFTDNGFTNLIEAYAGSEAYSYVFRGEAGYLDHAIASDDLAAQVTDVATWHINADEPRILDYNTEYKSQQQVLDFYAPDSYRASDHDPVIVTLDLQAAELQGDFDGDGDVDSSDMKGLMRAILTRQTIDMAFDLNDDGVINTRDLQIMYTLCSRASCATE
ncbi:ExeM/NucH family extracellular endonuclease [Lacimicrobium alkaliphilum]|uniref:LTD domain-containing protein n=1 Tax=Lacimicrobium alkaliphilum TaxID=1526571 RepID=A0ABQ1R420_9ALTE|nr:ExeM/NucH family extracellular endonuclease [Lacimicrobium alkaliphilum]GGD54981.1 hypothetical protein GCM10011357_08380 [Lacimicrobium alkaliphilum]